MAGKLHSALYALSQIIWVLLIGLIFLVFYFHKEYQKGQTINSLHSSKRDSTSNPYIFGLITDNHISKYNKTTMSDTETALNIFTESGAEKVLVCGDLTENFEGRSKFFKNSRQIETEFQQFKKVESKYPKNYIIAASGNHDEFSIESYNSEIHYVLKYVSYYSENPQFSNWENFVISNVKHKDVDIFVLNMYNYPSAPARIGHYSSVTQETLDIIERKLSEPSKATSRILITHYPLLYYNPNVQSSSKKTLLEIVSTHNLTAVLSGHTHKMRVIHHNGTLEIHPFSLKTFRGYSFVCIDNGGLSYHKFDLFGKRPFAVLAHPIDVRQVSKQTDFSIENFEKSQIRVVAFSERTNLNISVRCTKDAKLQFQRIIGKNQTLYSVPMSEACQMSSDDKLNGRKFELTFSGDWNYSTEFFVGSQVKIEKEYLENDMGLLYGILVVSLIYYIVILYIFGPLPPSKCGQKTNEWISGMPDEGHVLGVIFGFLPMKARIHNNLLIRDRITIFFLALVPFFFPAALIRFHDKSYGFFFLYGYYFKKICYDIYGQIFAAFYVLLVLVPATLTFSSLAQMQQINNWFPVFLLDAIVAIFQVPLMCFGIGTIMYQSTSFVLSLFSPYFGFAPLILIILEIVVFSRFMRNLKSERKLKTVFRKSEQPNRHLDNYFIKFYFFYVNQTFFI